MRALHARSPIHPDYSLCGFAQDSGSSEGRPEDDLLFVSEWRLEPVTCLDCRRVVIEVRKIKIGRLPK